MVKNKRGRTKQFVPNQKKLKDVFHRNTELFKWDFSLSAWEHKGWKEDCNQTKYFVEQILSKLKHFETQTWQEIQNSSGGKQEGNGNNNHFINVSRLPKIAKEYLIDSALIRDYDEAFSLRLSSKERLVGVADRAIFRVIWYDIDHSFF